jgi:hypothetical protein
MSKHADQPFFVMLSYLSPHGPIEAPQHLIEKYENKGCSNDFARLNGMIEMVDNNVGRLLAYLKKKSLDKNTIVIFISDNGSTRKAEKMKLNDEEWAMRHQGFRGNKGNIWQNAMKAPCFVHWNGVIKADVRKEFTTISDIFPTLVELTGSQTMKLAGPLQGMSWKPLLMKRSRPWPKGREFFRSYWNVFKDSSWNKNFVMSSSADISGENQINAWYHDTYKLVKYRDQKPVLFNLSTDPGEENNIAKQHPEMVKGLLEKIRASYGELLKSPRVFPQPRFAIGNKEHDQVERVGLNLRGSEIPTCGAVATTGGVVIESHASSGYTSPGDSQTILVDVVKSGAYRVILEASKPTPGAEMEVKVGKRHIQGQLTKSKHIDLGEINLLQGEQELTVKLLSLPTGKKRAFGKLAHVHFQAIP